MTDEELMTAHQGDRPGALAELHRRWHHRLRGWAVRKLRDPIAAEDVVQDTWLAVHRSRGSWKPGSPWSAWVWAIARNTLTDSLRRQRARPLVLMDELPEVPVESSPIVRMALQKAQETLSHQAMVAFTLGAVNGLDHNEMAQEMGVSPDCARARLSRAVRQVRECLA